MWHGFCSFNIMQVKVWVLLLILSGLSVYSQETTTSTTSTSSSSTTSTTAGKPVPEINPTPSVVAPPPPLTTPRSEAQEKGLHKSDMNILKWLLANDPEKPLEGIGINTKILKPLLKNPQIREALEALRQKLQNLDSQDPNDPEVQKIVKEFRATLMRKIAEMRLRNIRKKKATTPPTQPKQIAVGQEPDRPLPLPAKPVIVPEYHPPAPPPPPPTPSTEEIPPPTPSSESSTTTTTTTTQSAPAGPDPTLVALLALLQQLLNRQKQQQNAPQEIKDLADTLNKASAKCKEEIGKKSGGSSLLNEISTILGKNPPSDQDKERAKQLKTDFCNIANTIPDCSGVCDGGPGPSNPLDACKTYNSSCDSCPNADAKTICEFYKNNTLENSSCKSKIGQYADAAWFNQFLTTQPQASEITKKLEDMKQNVCEHCREAVTGNESTFCK